MYMATLFSTVFICLQLDSVLLAKQAFAHIAYHALQHLLQWLGLCQINGRDANCPELNTSGCVST